MKNNQTVFYVVRHGETAWNAKRIVQGQKDIPLNKTGEQQAEKLAITFASLHFDMAFSSDLLRAKRTAEIIAKEHDLIVATTNALRERDFGTLEGRPTREYTAYLRMLEKASDEDRMKHRHNEGFESDEAFTSRVITFLRETAIANPGKHILIGAHAGVFHLLMRHLGEYTYQDSHKYRLTNTGYVKIETDGVEFHVSEISGVEERIDTPKVK